MFRDRPINIYWDQMATIEIEGEKMYLKNGGF